MEGESSEISVHIYQTARLYIQHKYTIWIKIRILNDKAGGIREIAVSCGGGGVGVRMVQIQFTLP